jgi:hypothetical protein
MSKNPFMDRAAKRGSSDHGKVSEKRVAASLAARLTPASGAMRGAKSDARKKTSTHKFQIESKATTSGTLGVDYGWLVKVTEEAMATGSVPALTMSFVDVSGKAKPRGDWIAVPLWAFHQILEELGDKV